ncbi:MAG: LLM class flavin-dependent oxidoreductase [Chloroflexi bacterium]|nr:LLM class flavin-dependent oxidoreductase [Chloroflexota bacterium]
MSSVKVGLCLPLSDLAAGGAGRTFAQVAADARRAEELGFDSVWVSDHLFIEMAPGMRRGSLEPLSTLAAIGAQTSRVLLGSLVICNAFRHPGVLAKTAGTIQDISNGRLLLGIGAGWHQPEYDAYNLPFDRKVARLEESASALRALFHGDTVTREGKFYQFRNAQLLPKPAVPPKLWIAAFGNRILHLTARVADGWNFAWCGGDPEPFRRKVAELRRACAGVGRNPAEMEVSAGVLTMPLDEDADQQQEFERLQALAPQFRTQTLDQFKSRVIFGPPDEVVAGLRRLVDAGAQHLLVSVAPAPLARLDPAAIERLGALVEEIRGG